MEISTEAFMRELGWWIFLEVSYQHICEVCEEQNYQMTRAIFGAAVISLGEEFIYTHLKPH